MDRERMIEAGVDYDEGVERFGGKPELFEKYLLKFFAGDFLATIENQLQCGNIAGAFRTTHDLKSISGNLSLNRLYRAICELTELLRAGCPDTDYATTFQQVKMWYEKAQRVIVEAEQ